MNVEDIALFHELNAYIAEGQNVERQENALRPQSSAACSGDASRHAVHVGTLTHNGLTATNIHPASPTYQQLPQFNPPPTNTFQLTAAAVASAGNTERTTMATGNENGRVQKLNGGENYGGQLFSIPGQMPGSSWGVGGHGEPQDGEYLPPGTRTVTHPTRM